MKHLDKVIDGKSVGMTSLDFFTQMQLKRVVIAPIMKSLSSVFSGGLDGDFNIGGVTELISFLDEKQMNELIEKVLSRCTVEGTDMSDKLSANELLSSETVLFYKIVGFFLEVNYSDFLEIVRTGLAKAGLSKEKVTGLFSELSTSTTKTTPAS